MQCEVLARKVEDHRIMQASNLSPLALEILSLFEQHNEENAFFFGRKVFAHHRRERKIHTLQGSSIESFTRSHVQSIKRQNSRDRS